MSLQQHYLLEAEEQLSVRARRGALFLIFVVALTFHKINRAKRVTLTFTKVPGALPIVRNLFGSPDNFVSSLERRSAE